MVTGFALLIVLLMKLFPALPLSRLLHHSLVEAPLRKLASMDRRHLIYAAVLIGIMFAGVEVILMLGSADVVMLLAWDVSLYVDAVIAAWTLSMVARSRAAWQALAASVTRFLRRTSRPRSPRRQRSRDRAAANDSDDEESWAYALAA